MSAPDSGIHLGFDVVELDEGDLEAILREGGDGNGFYTLKSKPPVACSLAPPWSHATTTTTTTTAAASSVI